MRIAKKEVLKGRRHLSIAVSVQHMHITLKGRLRRQEIATMSSYLITRKGKKRSAENDEEHGALEKWERRTPRKKMGYYDKPRIIPKPGKTPKGDTDRLTAVTHDQIQKTGNCSDSKGGSNKLKLTPKTVSSPHTEDFIILNIKMKKWNRALDRQDSLRRPPSYHSRKSRSST